MINTKKIRKYFPAIQQKRICTNNAASAQAPTQLLKLLEQLVKNYDNVHRGQSMASQQTTKKFEEAYETIAQFIGAESMQEILLFRNATEAINCVMYSLLTEFKDGDNIITTMMEHNSNYVPWYALCKEILNKFGIHVEYRLCRFNHETGELDLEHYKSLVDNRTKLVCCNGVSNFLGVINPLKKVHNIAKNSGYTQPDGRRGSYFLVDACQMIPNMFVNVQELDVDFLAWSFHKILAPFGVGGLYAKKELLMNMKPFLYGGDMIADGQVKPDKVSYNNLPWKYAAGTPNILGTILSAEAMRLLIDFSLYQKQGFFGIKYNYFNTNKPLEQEDVKKAMNNVLEHEHYLAKIALEELQKIPNLIIYGPKDYNKRTSLISFNYPGISPMAIATMLNDYGVESRAGCHCATLAHHDYGLTPPASCRLSFYIYNDENDVKKACEAVKEIIEKLRSK